MRIYLSNLFEIDRALTRELDTYSSEAHLLTFWL